MTAPVSTRELERVAVLHSCGVLDTLPEPAFDDVARLASQLCGTPIGLVSLVDTSRQWFKARVGVDLPETPRESAFCAHTVLGNEPLIVPDAQKDPRFADNPFVTGEPHVRFYAGMPLVLEPGLAVGALCVIDTVPRQLSDAQLDGLQVLAHQIVRELSLRRRLTSLAPRSSVPPAANVERPGTDPGSRPSSPNTDTLARGSKVLAVDLGGVVDDRYRVERVLGVGGMGVVVQARDLSVDREVAIKFIRLDMLTHFDAVERFVREAQALLSIQGRHITRVFDVGNAPNGAPFIVMELLEGEDLAARLHVRGHLPPREAVRIVLQATYAVESAHAHGILHRDLKPANLFLHREPGGEEIVKVLDFGISKLWNAAPVEAPTALTSTRAMVGSPMYMAPEQMTRGGTIDERSDIWSLGVVLYEAITGALPYGGASVPELCANVLTLSPIPIEARRSDVPASVRAIIHRCLGREPRLRYASANKLTLALEDALAKLPEPHLPS